MTPRRTIAIVTGAAPLTVTRAGIGSKQVSPPLPIAAAPVAKKLDAVIRYDLAAEIPVVEE